MQPCPKRRRALAWLGLMGVAGFLALLVAAPAAAAGSLDLTRWAYYRQIDTSGQPDGLVRVKLDGTVYAGARTDLADLRIVDDQGQEIPSEIDFQQTVSAQRDRWQGKLSSVKPGKADGSGTSSFDLDLGGPRPFNHVYLTADGRDFWKQVTVQGSADGKAWTPIAGVAYVWDFTSLEGGRSTDFAVPRSTYRWLRVSLVDQGTAPLKVQSAWTTDEQVTDAAVDRVPTQLLKPPANSNLQSTVVVADTGPAAPPVHQITLDTPDREFHRFVKVESSGDGATWRPAGEGAIWRYDLPTRRSEGLQIAFRPVSDRYLRLTMPDSGEGSLRITRVDAWAFPRFVQFRLSAAHRYTLWYGASDAAAPDYKPGSLGVGVVVTLPETALGPQLQNLNFRGTTPPAGGSGSTIAGAATGSKGETGGTGAGQGSAGANPAAVAGWSALGAAGLGAGATAYYYYTKLFGGKGR